MSQNTIGNTSAAASRTAVQLALSSSDSKNPPKSTFQIVDIRRLALPDLDDSPPTSSQLEAVPPVPSLIARELGDPIVGASLRNSAATAVVVMPEAAMYEDDHAVSSKDQIRRPRQVAIAQSKS